MNYVIHSMGMPFNGDTIKTQSLGGSETAAYYLGKELAARGHRVVMFTNSQDEGVFDGVTYCWLGNATKDNPLGERFAHFACNTPHDVLVIQRHPLAFHKDYASKVNVHQMHDLALRRTAGAINAGAARVDLVTGVSQFHIDQIKDVYNLPDRTLRVVPNGVDEALYAGVYTDDVIEPVMRAELNDKFPILYQSRPERGLEHLLRPDGIMDKLAKAGSKAHLFYCAYKNTVEQMVEFYDYLESCATRLPNVTNLGALTKRQLAEVQKLCSLLVYPTEFEEVSCITAMEAMHAGLPLVSSAHAALPETCEGAGAVLLPLVDGHADEDAFVTRVMALELDGDYRNELRAKQIESAATRTWEHAVDLFEDAVEDVFSRRAESPARMARHLIEHSDISAFEKYQATNFVECDPPEDAIEDAALLERDNMYSFKDSLAATVAHYEKWEGMNCDRMEATGLNPDAERAQLVTTSRFRGIHHLLAQAVAEKINEGKEVRVLEFGCAHGHITLALAEAFPQVQFTGMDFMSRSVELARKTAFDRGLKNITFEQGSLDNLDALGKFDAVIAPEVVEHIWDYASALVKLLRVVAFGGDLIITTPTGRWEWTGRHWWHKGREHLHHFERTDIVEMFKEFNPTILHAPGGHDVGGEALGSWVYAAHVKDSTQALAPIDYTRKLLEQAPRDTVSLCMIAKDAQDVIANALRSVAEVVDEVVIAVDEKTTDKTEERIAEVAADFPHVAFTVFRNRSPLEIGFDEARNATIERSCGDWILWMDADEEVVGANNILRLLRPGAFDGYAIAQNHMSQDPPECISTDYPTRLFRRDSGARFYGVVHEHPEVEIGKAIPHTQQISDIRIMHYGYSTEVVRRGRFMRNYPLLLRDLEKHPNRTLNKFLHLRDLAQGLAHEGQATGGVSEDMRARAAKIVELFKDLIDNNPMLRMTLDAIPYYSTGVAILGGGFKARISVQTSKEEFPGIAAKADAEGLFDSIETYTRLMARIAKETTVNYEATYL